MRPWRAALLASDHRREVPEQSVWQEVPQMEPGPTSGSGKGQILFSAFRSPCDEN